MTPIHDAASNGDRQQVLSILANNSQAVQARDGVSACPAHPPRGVAAARSSLCAASGIRGAGEAAERRWDARVRRRLGAGSGLGAEERGVVSGGRAAAPRDCRVGAWVTRRAA